MEYEIIEKWLIEEKDIDFYCEYSYFFYESQKEKMNRIYEKFKSWLYEYELELFEDITAKEFSSMLESVCNRLKECGINGCMLCKCGDCSGSCLDEEHFIKRN